jgi:hypothetical protein
MKECPKCGYRNDTISKICGNCGGVLDRLIDEDKKKKKKEKIN